MVKFPFNKSKRHNFNGHFWQKVLLSLLFLQLQEEWLELLIPLEKTDTKPNKSWCTETFDKKKNTEEKKKGRLSLILECVSTACTFHPSLCYAPLWKVLHVSKGHPWHENPREGGHLAVAWQIWLLQFDGRSIQMTDRGRDSRVTCCWAEANYQGIRGLLSQGSFFTRWNPLF